ncbi:helix-turn-helix domain-containing protein [Tsukamurella sp. USMM236]|uniref:helix-turn-helix domain-containing protein n=1 Tax=Tsukamurella sp. USMM236 TaxID=3081301 RepID=UPI0030162876
MGTNDPNHADALLTLREASELNYGAPSTLRAYIASGKLPAVKIGGRIRIRRADLEALTVPARGGVSTEEAIASAARALVATAPPLSAEQLDTIAAAFADAVDRELHRGAAIA